MDAPNHASAILPAPAHGALPAPAAPCAQSGHKGEAESDHAVVERLRQSAIFRDYQTAYESATGFPLTLRPVGSFLSPLHGSKQANRFCQTMAAQSASCAACLRLQEQLEKQATTSPASAECFAGLTDTAIPIRIGERVVAFLQTGQVFTRKPSATRFEATLRRLRDLGLNPDVRRLRETYFATRVVTRRQYDSATRLIGIFAEHIASLGNELMVKEASAESPTVARARAYVTAHIGEEISLCDVSRAANMSIFYFCKVFKRETGLTFTEYLARTRIESVKQLLLDPHRRVSEAAYAAGFQSLSQFNRVFRRFAGETPSAYREHLHGHGEVEAGHGHLTRAA